RIPRAAKMCSTPVGIVEGITLGGEALDLDEGARQIKGAAIKERSWPRWATPSFGELVFVEQAGFAAVCRIKEISQQERFARARHPADHLFVLSVPVGVGGAAEQRNHQLIADLVLLGMCPFLLPCRIRDHEIKSLADT